jgi:hypothetical protein
MGKMCNLREEWLESTYSEIWTLPHWVDSIKRLHLS